MTANGNSVDIYQVEPRDVLGKKVKRMRREGVLPANIYGRGIESVAVQMPTRAAREMLVAHGTNTLIQLRVTGEKRERPVMVRAVSRHPASGVLQHLDFYQVDLSRSIQATVPVTVVGEAPAVDVSGGILLHGANSVQVEALPADIPTHLEVSVDGLKEIDQQVTVADLIVPDSVTVLADAGIMLARVSRPRILVEAHVLEGEELPEGEEAERDQAEDEAQSE